MSNPTFISESAKLADELAPTHKEMVELAQQYWLRKNPADVVLQDGERLNYFENERKAKKLNEALKDYIKTHGPIEAEGLPPLMVQESTTYQVDVKSLAEHDARLLARLLDLGCLRVDINALDAAEKSGQITGVPRMPLKGSERLVFVKERGR